MSEKQVGIKLTEGEAKLLEIFLGMTEVEDIEKICKEYSIDVDAYTVDDILYKIYNQLRECKKC